MGNLFRVYGETSFQKFLLCDVTLITFRKTLMNVYSNPLQTAYITIITKFMGIFFRRSERQDSVKWSLGSRRLNKLELLCFDGEFPHFFKPQPSK